MAHSQLDRLRALCLALPETTERRSHGEPAWFIRDKRLFVTYADHHHDDRLAFWCAAPEGAQVELVASDPTRFFIPPYVGHRGWLGVYLDVPTDWREMAEIVTDAYRVVAPKRLLEQSAGRATQEAAPDAPGTEDGPSAAGTREEHRPLETRDSEEDARARLMEICHRLPEISSEGTQHIAFVVRKRKYAYYLEDHHGDGRVALACKAEAGENTAIIASDPTRFFMPSYVGARGWVGMWLDLPEVNWDEVQELVFNSYRLIAPKRLWGQIEQSQAGKGRRSADDSQADRN